MIKIMIGKKGAGKTKVLVEMVNAAAASEKGNVICINSGNRFMYDLDHSVRLINTDDFSKMNFDQFYGFIKGAIAGNYDITHVFIDSIMKVVDGTAEDLDEFLQRMERLSEKFDISFTITISADKSEASDLVKSYCIDF